jgi:predicted metalloprotease with PDZ domain
MRSLAVIALAAACQAALSADYTFTPGAETGSVQIKLGKNQKATEFRMPAWLPGDYQIFDYGKVIENVSFSLKDKTVASERVEADPNLWKIPAGADTVSYTVKPSRGNFSPNLQIRGGLVFINGGGVFGYFGGHKDEVHNLKLMLPDSHQGYSALPGRDDKYTAPDYDVLIDSPIVMGPPRSIRVAEKMVYGKLHRVLVYGDNANANVDGLLAVGASAAEQAFQLFGELPYDRYTYFFDMGGPGGGLEHLNSTRIGLGRNTSPQSAVGIIFHEYFHAFNVKRIRSKPLGPFDYTKPAITGAIWWLEGVTDYYADLLATRAGHQEPLDGFNSVFQAAMNASRNKYLEISADEASRRVWETRGSFGFGGVSYYARGHALGFYLDMAIRTSTNNAKSLDDVMVKLYKECKEGPGFGEDRIRQLVVSIGGSSLGPVYDRAVKEATALDFSPFFTHFGVQMSGGNITSLGRTNWPKR